MSESMVGSDIWVKYTSKKGESHIAYHRVWSLERFMRARADEAPKTGVTAKLVDRPPFPNRK